MTTMTPTFAMVIKARLMTLSESHSPFPATVTNCTRSLKLSYFHGHIGFTESSPSPFLAENLRLDRPLLKGLPLRSDKRKLRALDSADGQAPRPARKGICF